MKDIEIIEGKLIPVGKIQLNRGQIEGLPKNPRLIKDEKFETLKQSIIDDPELLGLRELLVYPHEDKYVIIGGNMRYRAMKELGYKECPCKIISENTPVERLRAIVLKDNGQYGEWNMDMLANEWEVEELELAGIDFDFDIEEEDDGNVVEEDDFDEEKDSVPTICALGDVWLLGEHRLMCGDSTKAENYAVLMEGKKAQMTFSDPPYNIAFKGSMSNTTKNGVMVKHISANQKHDYIKNDCMSKEQFEKFMLDFLQRVKDNVTGAWYISFAAGTLEDLLIPLRKQGMDWKSIIIWMKNQATLSMKDFKSRYEPIAYGRFDKTFYGENAKNEDIWEYQRTLKNDLHPTMKPIPLIAHMLEMSSKEGDIVLDCFGGSGSTLIACEQLGRKARLMELDPHYCDVIIARWEKLTGQTAEKIGG